MAVGQAPPQLGVKGMAGQGGGTGVLVPGGAGGVGARAVTVRVHVGMREVYPR